MGNCLGLENEPSVFVCQVCRRSVSIQQQISLRHGLAWVELCGSICQKHWQERHDEFGYCCDPKKSLNRPLVHSPTPRTSL